MPRSPSFPTYRLHKPTGQAVVTIRLAEGVRRDVYLGLHDSPESRVEYAKIIKDIAAGTPIAKATPTKTAKGTIDQMLLPYWRHVEQHYRTPDGKPTTEVKEIKASLIHLRALFGNLPADEFGPKALAAVRQRMIEAGWCRGVINRRTDRIKRAFKWAASEEIAPVTVYQALRTLAGLQKGRCDAREAKPVKPVALETVNATLPLLPHHIRVMTELMMYTGMRPGEVCSMTLAAIDRTERVWIYRPTHHKTAHRGKERIIPIGPRAKAVLNAFLAEREIQPDGPIFSPATAREERFAELRTSRKSGVQPSQRNRRKPAPKLSPKDHYDPHAITHAIRIACEKLHPLPEHLAPAKGEKRKVWWARLTELQRAEVKAHREANFWNPYRIRHAFGTRVRQKLGIEAAGAALGHSKMSATEVYAERDTALAARVASELG